MNSSGSFLSTSPTLFRPAAALIGWTFVMEGWMYATRLPNLGKYNVDTSPEFTPQKMNDKLPAHLTWAGHNYNHLHEAPTRFYAIVGMLSLIELKNPTMDMSFETTLAWTYVGLRMVHSVVQAVTNVIPVRLGTFAASEATMLWLFGRAAQMIM